jgi:serine/threonine-protein kinase
MHASLIAAATAALLLCAAGQSAAAQDNYGAIAFSPATGAHGWSYDYPSRSAAENAALANCGRYASDCRVPIWFRNACGALAVGAGNGYGSGWGTSRAIAERYALQVCRRYTSGCRIRRWACTTR